MAPGRQTCPCEHCLGYRHHCGHRSSIEVFEHTSDPVGNPAGRDSLGWTTSTTSTTSAGGL